jgi:hypothetical protein
MPCSQEYCQHDHLNLEIYQNQNEKISYQIVNKELVCMKRFTLRTC